MYQVCKYTYRSALEVRGFTLGCGITLTLLFSRSHTNVSPRIQSVVTGDRTDSNNFEVEEYY